MPQDSTYVSAVPENMTLTVEKTAIDVTAVMTGTLPAGAIGQEQKISIRLTLPATMPVADLVVSWQKQPDGWPEAGWICLRRPVSARLSSLFLPMQLRENRAEFRIR